MFPWNTRADTNWACLVKQETEQRVRHTGRKLSQYLQLLCLRRAAGRRMSILQQIHIVSTHTEQTYIMWSSLIWLCWIDTDIKLFQSFNSTSWYWCNLNIIQETSKDKTFLQNQHRSVWQSKCFEHTHFCYICAANNCNFIVIDTYLSPCHLWLIYFVK